MSDKLPPQPSLEHSRKSAKQLLRALKAAEAAALARAARSHPQHLRAADDALSGVNWQLSDAQLILAREQGCASWPQLKAAIEERAPLIGQASRFIRRSFAWQDSQAPEILSAHPQIASFNPACMAACGEHQSIARLLQQDPDAARAKFEPLERELLLYVCYSPLHVVNEQYRSGLLECARLLLKAGADPNAAYDEGPPWAGSMQTCLYGATGHGNFPAMAKLLLEAGADPNDDECLWHCPQFMYEECMELLLKHGADPSRRSEHWTNTPLYFLLGHRQSDDGYDTAMRGVAWLLEHGADPNVPCYDWQENCIQLAVRLHHKPHVVRMLLEHGADGSYRRQDGSDAWQLAMRSGNLTALELLREFGFAREDGTLLDRYMFAVMSADGEKSARLLAANPGLLDELGKQGPDSFCDAAEVGREDVVRVMLADGWDVAMTDDWLRTPLHCAALRGFADVVSLLLAAGAPLDQKDKLYGGTPLGWALHGALEMPTPGGDYLSVCEQLVAAGALDFVNSREICEQELARVREKYGNQDVGAGL